MLKKGIIHGLQHCILNGLYDDVKKILDDGFDINESMDGLGETIFIYSVVEASDDIFNLLLSYNPDVNKQQKNGRTALSRLVSHVGNLDKGQIYVERIQKLLDLGASCLIIDIEYSTKTCAYTIKRTIFDVLEQSVKIRYLTYQKSIKHLNLISRRKEKVYCLLRNRYCEEITLFQLMIEQVQFQ